MISNPFLGLALTHLFGFINGNNEDKKSIHKNLLAIIEDDKNERQYRRIRISIGKIENPVPENFIAFLYQEHLQTANNNHSLKSFAEREAERIHYNNQITH